MLNNKNSLFKSKLFCRLYIQLLGGSVQQGAYVLEDLIRRFCPQKDLSKKQLRQLAVQVAYNYAVYGFQTDEFFIYDIRRLSDYGKSQFITEGKSRWYFYGALNNPENTVLFNNKSKTYELFGKYFGRECFSVTDAGQAEEYARFIAKYDQVIVKPLDSSDGKGVQLLQPGTSVPFLLEQYKTGFILEPKLKNDPAFEQFHPASLNTVRIGTVRLDDRVEVPFAFIRLGQGGSCIDNAKAGGIFGLVDIATGVIVSACDESCNHYIYHPDSGKEILGFEIPRWGEAIRLVKELAQIVPDNRYTGWDVALTNNGWVLIEANCKGQFICQMPLKEGIKPLFDRYLLEIQGRQEK